ncbi:MAG: DUF389 domain-containing protein, partial [Bacteroidaceae bacterium]|nr:DUF389 domain-containing protein [Bacteroidaceae bacterium]
MIDNLEPKTTEISTDTASNTEKPSFSRPIIQLFAMLRYYLDLKRERAGSEEVITSIESGVEFRGTNLWVLICAVFIASLGLNVNSTAVIIGAMLISPLMGPIMGIGLALAVNDGSLLRRSAKNLFVATLFALLTSCIYFLISPLNDARSELLARTQPTVYDVLIAFFGGFAGIIATGSRHKGNVIPGVAIATALMPPLCTAGFGLATWQSSFFFGAIYLFFINCVYICVATWLGVRILKLPKHVTLAPQKQKLMMRWVGVLLVLVMVPSIITTIGIVRRNILETKVQLFVNREFGTLPDTQVLNYKFSDADTDTMPTLEVTLIGDPLPQESIDVIGRKMAFFNISDVQLKVLQFGAQEIDEGKLSTTIAQGVLKVTQEQLDRQRTLTDSLRHRLQYYESRENEAAELLPVLKPLFPQVTHIAISHTQVTSVETRETMPSTIVVAYIVSPMSPAERTKMRDWLMARQHTQTL